MKVITVSRNFPAYHIKAGEPTYFIEQIYNDVFAGCAFVLELLKELNPKIDIEILDKLNDSLDVDVTDLKRHTIRKGKRWKNGEEASLRIWSGKPYNSKQIEFARVKLTVIDFEIKEDDADEPSIYLNGKHYAQIGATDSIKIANNDGLMLDDFKSWFRYPKNFSGQLLSWSGNLYEES